MQLPPGTTECNHSYHAGNSFSASHSVQQLQNCTITISVQSLAYTQEANGVPSSSFVSSPPLPCSTISSQVTAGPTRNVTGDVMPLAEAITQLSFLEFLQCCGVLIAPPQPSQLPVPISLLDAAVQAIPHSTLSQHVSTQMGYRSASSCSVDMFVQTPIRSAVLHDVATQLPLTEFLIGCIYSNSPLDRQNFFRQSPSPMQGSRALLQPPPGLEQLAPPSGLAIGSHLYTTHGASVTAAPPRARLRSAISVTPPQPPASTTHVGPHHPRSATKGKRSASTAVVGTHNLAITDSRAGSVPFPKPRALVLPLVHFGQSKPEGHTGLDTADSDLMHHQFRLSLLPWNPGPARKHPTDIVSAACGKFHAVILQEACDHVPHISDQFMAFTGNTDLAILLNKDTFEPDPIVNTFKADSSSKGTWSMILLIVRGLLRRPSLTGSPTITFCSVHIHNFVPKKRDDAGIQC